MNQIKGDTERENKPKVCFIIIWIYISSCIIRLWSHLRVRIRIRVRIGVRIRIRSYSWLRLRILF